MKKAIFLFVSLLLLPHIASARLNVSVTNNPQVYQLIDTLASFGLIDNVILGQRPYSETRIWDFIHEAQKNMPRLKGTPLEPRAMILLSQLELFLPDETVSKSPSITPLEQFSLQYLFLDSPYRAVPPNVSNAQINAVVNPLVAYQGGRSYKDGQNFMFESEHRLHINPYFDIQGQPQFFLAKQADIPQDTMQWSFDNLYLRSEFANIGIQIGRDQLVWGPDPEGGSILSTNARGLDMIKISNVDSFHLPWIFKYLGYMDTTFFFGDMGSSYSFPYAYISGYKISLLPIKNFEFGFTYSMMSGGYGAPSQSLGSRAWDVFGGWLPNLLGGSSPVDGFASNRIGGFEFLFRIPKLRGAQIYWEFTLDDANFDQYKFVNESMNKGGIFIPRLSADGRHSLRLEYKNAGFLPYRHEQFTDGWTRHQLILGDQLGPDAQGAYVRYSFAPTYFWQQHVNFAWEDRDSDVYSIPNVHVTTYNPNEMRYRLWTDMRWRESDHFEIALAAGYERVSSFNFVPGDNRNNFLTDLKLTWYPAAKTSLPKRKSSDS